MRIVVLGANGMLGRDLVDACEARGWAVAGFDLPELDIAAERPALERLPHCDWVVNCAAYTDVDGAETNREAAYAVNCIGAGRVARWCAAEKIRLLHISTDYIFDGLSTVPYVESDVPNPLNVYGRSKYEGELVVRSMHEKALIVRTQSLFGIHGRNFVKSILRKSAQGTKKLHVVYDQISCPTYTRHLADAILKLVAGNHSGTVHVSASGQCSWYEFACAIVEATHAEVDVEAIPAERYGSPARRPPYSVLSKELYRRWTGHNMPTWKEGLNAYLREELGAG
ncbi:MAG: dTDP-4-dehydrorhamnose reductase [Kiritimatiellia bacterium]